MKISSIIIGLIFLITTTKNSGDLIALSDYEAFLEDSFGSNYFISSKYADQMYLVFKVYKPYNPAYYDFVVYIKGFSKSTLSLDDFEDTTGWNLLQYSSYEEYYDYDVYVYPFQPDYSVRSLGYSLQSNGHFKVGVYVSSGKYQKIATILLSILISLLFTC